MQKTLGFVLRSMNASSCAVVFFMLIPWMALDGQETLSSAHWLTQNEGLLESTNAFIYKDQNGFVWISSLDGLNRFDGRTMQSFRTDPSNPNSIYGNNIQSPFFETKKGDIWFVTEDAINCYRRRKGHFEHYFIRPHAIPNSREQYYAFHLEQDRYLWVRADEYLYRFDTYYPGDSTKTQALHPFLGMRCAVTCKKDGTVQRVYGCFWDLQAGLEAIDYNEKRGILRRQLIFTGANQEALTIRQALPKNDSLVWLASNRGLISLVIGTASKPKFDIYPLAKKEVKGIRELTKKTDREILVLTQAMGEIRSFDETAKKYSSPLDVSSGTTDIPNQMLKSIYLSNRELWGAAYGQGVFFSSLQTKLIAHLFFDNQIGYPKVIQIQVTKDNQIWVFTELGETVVLDARQKLLSRENLPVDSRIFEDTKGRIWCYSRAGFGSLTPDGHRLKLHLPSMDNFIFYGICERDSSHLLLSSNRGLLVIDKKTPWKYQTFTMPGVWSLYCDLEGKTWAATSTQLILFKQSGDHPPRTLKTFETGFVSSILSTPGDSNLWVSTLTGLRKFNRYTLQEDRSKVFPVALNHAIQSMVFDRQGVLWLAGNRGIFSYSPSTGALRHFTQRDGLHSSEFSPGSMQLDHLGNIWAGGNNGIDVIFPQALNRENPAPQLAITGLKIYDKDWIGTASIETVQKIDLPYNQNTLKFELAALEYTDPSRNEFKVFLQGYDQRWSNLGTQNFITYANLPAGHYHFLFTACNAQGVWQKQPKKLSIVIHPPYWRTWWFYTLIGLTVLAIMRSFFQYREQQRKKQERMRQQIARDLHDDVGSTLGSISILSESFLHNVEADLDKIRFSNIGEKARIALENISDIVWSVNPENDSMEKLLARMSSYAAEMLENAGTELLFQVGENMESMSLPIEKRKDFYLIFKEAVHNCAKYAKAKHIEIRLEIKNNTLSMSIKDDGVGFDPDKIENPGMGGNGLKNMQRRAAAIGGTFSIQSNPGEGANLHVAVPLVP